MSPFTIIVVLILTALFITLSVIPLLTGRSDMDSSPQSQRAKTKNSH
ncbi:MAG TPA: hypothetical protein VF359_07900 [Anaerolineales bacterium]|jgi:hypothetical protein